MKTKHFVACIAAIVLIPILCFFSYAFFCLSLEGIYYKDRLTARQQGIIAEALGFKLAPGENLTAVYQLSWLGTICYLEIAVSGIPSEEDFHLRSSEDTLLFWDGLTFYNGKEFVGRAVFLNFNVDMDYPNLIPIPKKVEKIIDSKWQAPYLLFTLVWGGPVAEVGLIVTLIVTLIANRRRAKKKRALAAQSL